MANDIAPAQNQPTPSPATIAGAPSSTGSMPFPSGKASIHGVLIKNRRLLLLTASSLMLLGFIGLLLWSADPPYRPVFSGISEQEAASVVETLQKEHIPYRLEAGSTVLVPSDQVYAARLKLAGQGVMPENGVGFELFDKSTPFGISDFAQKVNFQRALQGELARTIEVLPQVAKARVQLVLPKESAFVEHERQASASVMLQLSGGQRIPGKTVIAIQNLVAASVPALDRKTVTIVDSAGNLLSSGEKQTAMDAGQTQQEYKTQIERRLEERLTGMLEQMVGAGQAVVRVTAKINREYVEQNNQRYNPDEAVLRNQRVIKENSQASDSAASGVPGMASNTPGGKGNSATAIRQPSEKATRSEQTSNFEISSTTEKRIIPFGNIKRLSVAAIVGGSFREENGKSVFTPRGQKEMKTIQALIERAMGYDEDRGDTLEVQSLPLVDIASHKDALALKAAEQKAFYVELARYGVAGLALLLLAWFVLRPMAKRLAVKNTAVNDIRQKIETASISGPAASALPAAAPEHLEWQKAAKGLVVEDPNLAAKILNQWTQQA